MKILKSSGAFDGNIRVFICVCCYDGVTAETVYSLFGAKEALMRNGIDSELEIVSENCHIDDSRNYALRDFLESQCDCMVFVDADVRFDPEDLVRLIRYDRDVVAGVYPKKKDGDDYPVMFIGGEIWIDKDGLIEVEGVPTGFLKISRPAAEKVSESAPKFVNQNEETRHTLKISEVFKRQITDFTRLGGDYEFCRRWRSVGGQIFVDPLMRFGHRGNMEFEGGLGAHLIKKNELAMEYIPAFIELIPESMHDIRKLLELIDVWGNPWTPPADMLVMAYEIAKTITGPILECGSGLSTLFLGASGNSVTSLEHDKKWFDLMSGYVSKCDLSNVTILNCPIENGFYNANIGEDKYSMVFVDGPPRKVSGGSGDRSKIVDLVNVSDDCVWIVDDANTDIDVTEQIAEKYNVKFKYTGRYAIGRRHD